MGKTANTRILLVCFFYICIPLLTLGQNNSLKIIEPILKYTPILDKKELDKELQKIEEISTRHNNNYEKYLTQKQLELKDWYYSDRDDHLDISIIGDSWYNCAWPEKITASSELKQISNISYEAHNAHDFSLRTAWIEGMDGYGINEYITYHFAAGNAPVTTVDIFNGYMKSDKTWIENSRVKQLKLYINEKPYALLDLKDTIAMQSFNIGLHKPTESGLSFKFEIMDIYKGDKYDDVAISEIEFDGTGCLCFAKGTMISTPEEDKPVEQLKTGDKIVTLNTLTNQIDTTIVQDLASRKHQLYELRFTNDIKIKTTTDHPFYYEGIYYSITENNIYNIQTKQLTIGQEINYLKNGKLQTAKLEHIEPLEGYHETYTITKIDKGRLFFANKLCVATEEL